MALGSSQPAARPSASARDVRGASIAGVELATVAESGGAVICAQRSELRARSGNPAAVATAAARLACSGDGSLLRPGHSSRRA